MKKQGTIQARGNEFGKQFDRIVNEVLRLEQKVDTGFDALHSNFRDLQGSVNAYAKKADTYFQEMVMLAH